MALITPPKTNLTTTSHFNCEICDNTGWIVDSDNVARPCECYKRRLQNNRIKFANIPETYKKTRLDDFKTDIYGPEYNQSATVILNAVKLYLENLDNHKADGIGIYLFSKTKGSGKTLLATGLANELIYNYNMNVRFATSLDIISEIKATWDRANDLEFRTESKLMTYLTDSEVLVIDDFGTEKHKEWLDDKFYQIINTRYVKKLITIFTSNYSIDQLAYDDRITNRIKERSFAIRLPEKSIREDLAKELQGQLRGSKNG